MWHTAQTFTDFLDLNRQYNSGDNADPKQWLDPHSGPLKIDSGTRDRLLDLELFVYRVGEGDYWCSQRGTIKIWNRPYLSMWCPDTTAPLKLIKSLQGRSDVIVYAAKLHPFEVVEGTPAEPTDLEKNHCTFLSGELECENPKVEAEDLSTTNGFWNLDNIRLLRPCLIDLIAVDWEWKVEDLAKTLRETINQCNWSNV